MTKIPTKADFEQMYQQPPPWDIGRPQAVFARVADEVRGDVLDAGCGTGEQALFFAARGHAVTGIDFLEEPIRQAQQKAAARGLVVTFLVLDALHLDRVPRVWHTILDSGLFHALSDADRVRYVQNLSGALSPEGILYLLCFSDKEPGTEGPRRISEPEIRSAFADGWGIESLEAARFEIRPDFVGMTFTPGGPHAWFARIRRLGHTAKQSPETT